MFQNIGNWFFRKRLWAYLLLGLFVSFVVTFTGSLLVMVYYQFKTRKRFNGEQLWAWVTGSIFGQALQMLLIAHFLL